MNERDLGTVYDQNLKPVYGAKPIYEDHTPRRNRRDEMSKSLTTLRNTLQLHAGFNYLFLRFGTNYTSAHEYQLYRAFHVAEVVSVDETRRMWEPAPDAVFYLAELHLGASYDMLIETDSESMGIDLSGILKGGTWSAGSLEGKYNVKIEQAGLGLEPRTSDAIFAMTPGEVRQHYRAAEVPVPIKLVFRTIPGRSLKERKLPRPEPVVTQKIVLEEGASRRWGLQAGRYLISTTSTPNGLQVGLSGDFACDTPPASNMEYTRVKIVCNVQSYAELTVTNYTTLGMGPSEHANVRVFKVPD